MKYQKIKNIISQTKNRYLPKIKQKKQENHIFNMNFNQEIIINMKSEKSVTIYYSTKPNISETTYQYKYENVTNHEFILGNNLVDKLYMYIIKTTNQACDIKINYKTTNLEKYAVIVGISDYRYISDLDYCDEDASSWVSYLQKLGYQCIVFGDTHVQNYLHYAELATESNVRNTINKIGKISTEQTKFVFCSSGHGAGDGNGSSYLCMYDCQNSPNGQYTDLEFSRDIQMIRGQKFIFFDNCYSGGILDNLLDIDNLFATSTCSKNGFGWDVSKYKHGAWTYCFLIKTLCEYNKLEPYDIKTAFNDAKTMFPQVTQITAEGDQPEYITSCETFYL